MVSHPEEDGTWSGSTKLERPKYIKAGKVVVRPLKSDERHLLSHMSVDGRVSAKDEFLANETFAARACVIDGDAVRFENLDLRIFSQDIAIQAVAQEDSRNNAAPFDLNEKLGELADNFSRELFADIWWQLKPKLTSLVFSECRNAELTDEVVQEVGIRIGFRWSEIVKHRNNLSGLVYVIAINEMRGQIRKKDPAKIASELDGDDGNLLGNVADTRSEPHVEFSQRLQRSAEYLHRLSDIEHKCFYLNKVEASPVRQIAEQLGISNDQVNGALQRAKQKLSTLRAIDWLCSQELDDAHTAP